MVKGDGILYMVALILGLRSIVNIYNGMQWAVCHEGWIYV